MKELTQIQRTDFVVRTNMVRGKGSKLARIVGGRARNITSDEDKAWEREIRNAFLASSDKKDLAGFADEVHMRIEIMRKIPEGVPASVTCMPDLQGPSVDKISESVFDALEGVAFRKKSQITKVEPIKRRMSRRSDEILKVSINYFACTNAREANIGIREKGNR